VFSNYKRFIQLAPEVTSGTPAAPTVTLPVTKCDFFDKIHNLDDKSWNGSMSLMYGRQQGARTTDGSMSGNVYVDSLPHLLQNIMGDRTSVTAAAATTTAAATVAGATSVSATAAVGGVGALIQIDTGTKTEVVQVSATTGTGPYVLTVFPALQQAHASGVVVTPLTRHAFSLLNSGQGQTKSHTFYDFLGPGPNGHRVYPGARLTSLHFKLNAATSLFDYDAKLEGYPSLDGSTTLTAAPSGVQAMASWQAIVGIGGPAATSPYATVRDGAIELKRKVEADHTLQGSQAPYSLTQGELDISGKLTILATDDSAYQYYLSNSQPVIQIIVATGSGWVQIDLGRASFRDCKPVAGNKAAMEYTVDLDGIINAGNAGASGGLSPGLITVGNSVLATSY
jgi:hypothetical protein